MTPEERLPEWVWQVGTWVQCATPPGPHRSGEFRFYGRMSPAVGVVGLAPRTDPPGLLQHPAGVYPAAAASSAVPKTRVQFRQLKF